MSRPTSRSYQTIDSAERIKELASKEGVTIHLDMGDSETADMGSSYCYDPKKEILLLCVPNLNAKAKEFVLELIKQTHDDGGLLFKDDREQVLSSYTEYAAQSKYKNILNFFRAILPANDFEALRMSMFLRVEKEKGKDITDYKQDIRDKFGERGANISNLCSEGYFEGELMPLHSQVSAEDFNKYYELVVGIKARALFVSSNMDMAKIERNFEEMLSKAQRYHLKEFKIHGIGKSNVAVIKSFVSKKYEEKEEGYLIRKVYEDSDSTAIGYVVEINEAN